MPFRMICIARGEALQAGDIGLGGEVAVQGAFDIARMGALAFDPVGVVGIHGPDEFAQAGDGGRVGAAGEAEGAFDNAAAALAQFFQPALRQQRLELMGLGVTRNDCRVHFAGLFAELSCF